MREILFCGKRVDNGEWVYGDFVGYDMICDGLEDTVNATGEYYGQTPYVGFVDVIRETIGQYTGLTDKNGKKIFEGDIIKHHKTLWGEDASDIGVILWCERTCKFYRTSKCDTVGRFEIWEETAENYEVIGNIHDNPELLGGGEDG